MNRRVFLASGAAFALPPPAADAQAANAGKSDAKRALAEACAEAEASDRRLMLVFYASWCGYCTLLDMMLADETCAPIINAHFRVFHLRALEEKKHQIALQLAGADDVYASYAPKTAGLPYVALLDGKGAKVADSILANGDSIGFPATPEEQAGFDTMLKTAAPRITPGELLTLRRTCTAIMKSRA